MKKTAEEMLNRFLEWVDDTADEINCKYECFYISKEENEKGKEKEQEILKKIVQTAFDHTSPNGSEFRMNQGLIIRLQIIKRAIQEEYNIFHWDTSPFVKLHEQIAEIESEETKRTKNYSEKTNEDYERYLAKTDSFLRQYCRCHETYMETGNPMAWFDIGIAKMHTIELIDDVTNYMGKIECDELLTVDFSGFPDLEALFDEERA